MLATGRYLAGDLAGALAGWTLQGGPPADLIEVRGLRRIHDRTVAGALGVEARDTLTAGIFRRARRRLGQLPGLARARLGYSVLRDGSVRLEAAVMEHPHWPAVPVAAIGLAASAALQERASLELGPVLPVGERWRLSGRWEAASSAGAVTAALPWRTFDAVATVRAGWRSEDLADGWSVERRSATLGPRRWITSWTRGGLTVGLERWRGAGRLGRVGVDGLAITSEGAVRLGVAADGWVGPGARFGRGRAAAALRVPAGGGSRSWRTILGASGGSPGAPPLVWDGAGTGQVRAPLLRGYTLVDGGTALPWLSVR
jgi:hypothetical protein